MSAEHNHSPEGADQTARMYRPCWLPEREDVILRGLRHRVLHWRAVGVDTQLPLVVLLHGFQDCGDTFQFLVDALPRRWQFVALDWRGFGSSEWQQHPYAFADYLADLDALLQHLEPAAPLRLIGHSMGGNIAGLYAGVRPERVRWLVSLEGFGLRRSTPDLAPLRYREWLDQLRLGPKNSRHESTEILAAALQRRNPRLTPEIANFVADAWIRPSTMEGGRALHFDPWHRLVNPVLYRREEAEACWREVTAPVLVALGKESEFRHRLDMDGDIDRFIQCFRNVEVVDFPHLGHMLHHEDPAGVASRLAEWMLRQDSVTKDR